MNLSRLIIITLFIQWIYALSLSGIVYDLNRDGMNNVSIVISDNTSLNTVTNSQGEFFIKNIDFELFTIEALHIGFKPYINTINLDTVSMIEIFLEPEIIDLDRIVVTGTRSERHIKDTPMLTHVIGEEDISNSSYSNVKDILEMAMPNVQMVASSHGDNRVKIQGLDNKYLTFLVDGDRVSGEYAGNLDFSMLGLFNVDKIEVIEGAMSTLYGSGAMGGVVNIITKKNKDPYWIDLGFQYDNPIGISPFINTGFNTGIWNYNLNIQQTKSDGYDLSPDSADVYNMTLDENKSQIFNHRLILSPSDQHKVEFMYKNYSSRINKYAYYDEYLVIAAPLNRYDDQYYKIKYDYKISNNQNFKISYIEERYIKYYYYPYYYSDIISPEEFINAILHRQEINVQYNIQGVKYNRLIGLESYDENYSSFNIYYSDGEEMLQESIFEGQDLTKNDNNISLYFYEERNFKNNRILSFGLRLLNEDNIILPSISYLIKGINNYNYRMSYSAGYRTPSIKERYYQWEDHAGSIYILGNPDLKPSKNNYFSISLDKRSLINDFSVDVYRNYINNMISTEYDDGNLQYKNYDKVIINGINVHYYRKITDKLKLKFVYNLTDASSNSSEILEGISKHALRLNLYYKLLDKLDIVANVKYAGKKFIFDQEQNAVGGTSIQKLSSYSISDLYLNAFFQDMTFKIGVKNIFNYKDSNRLVSDILNNYDPGRRIFMELSLKLGGSHDK